MDVKTQIDMADVPERVLPPKEEAVEEEKENETIEVPAKEVAKDEPMDEQVQQEPDPVGSKTPPNLLYAKLDEERKRRKDLEKRIRELEQTPQPTAAPVAASDPAEEPAFPDIDQELKHVKRKLDEFERKETMREIMSEHPQISDKLDEFDDFLEEDENRKIPLRKAAKLFLLEKGLYAQENKNQRKGLESPTGGNKNPSSSPKTSDEDLKRLRETKPKLYARMLREGKIDV